MTKTIESIRDEIRTSLKNSGAHYEDYEAPVYREGYYPGAKPCGKDIFHPTFCLKINGKYLKSIGQKGTARWTKDWRFATTFTLNEDGVKFIAEFLSKFDDNTAYEFAPTYGHLLIQNHVLSLKYDRGLSTTDHVEEDKINGYNHQDHIDEAYCRCPHKYYDELPEILAVPVIKK